MPAAGWWDAQRGRERAFGAEWAWPETTIGGALLAAMARRRAEDKTHVGYAITPTTLLVPARTTIIERFTKTLIDPERDAPMAIGSLVHDGLTIEAGRAGYLTELQEEPRPVRCRVADVEVSGSPDAWWPDPATLPVGWPALIEWKVTTSGSVKFIMEDGKPKREHIAQASMYAMGVAAAWGVSVEEVAARGVQIEYLDMPQKEKTSMGYVRMPPGLKYSTRDGHFDLMGVEEIEALHPGYSAPRRPADYQGPPPPTVAETARTLGAAFEQIRNGADPLDVARALQCWCPARFNGQGRTYCGVEGECATIDHGIRMW